MTPLPLAKRIFEKAEELGIETITLKFSGGDDEGYLDIELSPWDKDNNRVLQDMVEDWAWDNYCYSGAGDGLPYGDNIIYNLEKKTVSSESWMTQRVTEDEETEELVLVEDRVEFEDE